MSARSRLTWHLTIAERVGVDGWGRTQDEDDHHQWELARQLIVHESSGPTVFGIFLSVQDCGARSLGQVKDVLFV